MVTSLQAEWQYICCVVPGIAKDLAPIKAAIHSDFLPALFGRTTPMTIDNDFSCLLSHSVKMGGIGIRNPTTVPDCIFAASKEAAALLPKTLMANANFLIEAHCDQVWQAAAAMRHDCMKAEEAFLEELSSRDCSLCNHLNVAKESSA